MRCIDPSSRRMPRKADEGGIQGRMSTEENAARRRMGGGDMCRIPGAGPWCRTTNRLTSRAWIAHRCPGRLSERMCSSSASESSICSVDQARSGLKMGSGRPLTSFLRGSEAVSESGAESCIVGHSVSP